MPMLFAVRLKITTNIKLQMHDFEGKPLIPPDRVDEPEVHYLQFEGENNRFPLGKGIFKAIWRRWRGQDLHYKEWTLTDLDNCLGGNPWTQDTRWATKQET